MCVGFEVSSSSDNESSDGGFVIQSWSFQTTGLPAIDPTSRPSHSVSDSIRSAPTLGGVAGRKDGRRRRLALGLSIPLPIVFLGAVMVFVLMSLKKWRRHPGLVHRQQLPQRRADPHAEGPPHGRAGRRGACRGRPRRPRWRLCEEAITAAPELLLQSKSGR